jgi:hypothetical protein
MNAKKDENGFMSAEQQNHRFINVLQLVYLNSDQNKVGSGYTIPKKIMELVETELDFNTNEKTKSKIISEQIKKYRKRKSYTFWSSILNSGNYTDYDSAKEVLMEIHRKTRMLHNSMTHERYAMETLHLALDDYFGTNKVKVVPSRFLTKKTKVSAKKKVSKKKVSKKKPAKKKSPAPSLDPDEIVF